MYPHKCIRVLDTECLYYPQMSRSTSRVFSRKLSPNEALLVSAASTQLHLHDPSFVPDTLQVRTQEYWPLIGQYLSCDLITRLWLVIFQDDTEITVPDTPEKSQPDPCLPRWAFVTLEYWPLIGHSPSYSLLIGQFSSSAPILSLVWPLIGQDRSRDPNTGLWLVTH